MGLHYDFSVTCRIHPDVEPVVLETLRRMTGDAPASGAPFEPPEHDYFRGNGAWARDFRQDGQEAVHFPGFFDCGLRPRYWPCRPDELRGYDFAFRCEMGDDHFYETFWRFLLWLSPHCQTQGWIGHYRSDISFHPTLLYVRDGRVLLLDLDHGAVPMPIDIESGEPWPVEERRLGEPIDNYWGDPGGFRGRPAARPAPAPPPGADGGGQR